jgi:ABC-2 type transport system permease protein
MLKYFSISALTCKNSFSNISVLLIRSIFLLTILFIFSQLWKITDIPISDITYKHMIWYVGCTEVIIISIPLLQFEIESDIRSGDIVFYLIKPINYVSIKLLQSLGELFFRYVTLAFIAISACTLLSDGWTPPLPQILSAYGIGFIAAISLLIFTLCIGLTSFHIQDCTPLFWLWQRCSFLLGGLMFPLLFYPKWLQNIAYLTPFPHLISTPASHLLNSFDYSLTITHILSTCAWGLLALFGTHRIFKATLRNLQINGG